MLLAFAVFSECGHSKSSVYKNKLTETNLTYRLCVTAAFLVCISILFCFYSMAVSLQRKEDFDSFLEREFEIRNLQVNLTPMGLF